MCVTLQHCEVTPNLLPNYKYYTIKSMTYLPMVDFYTVLGQISILGQITG
ncbi:hypothetical protein DES40_1252 [Litorimonas taeanensis]|uniref:Uncharacterized protein n=1 Tax=Litorimonas taeanensis TaxID=568099 RepID=A0A420WLQ3_9PROT|nr:hypothetical protein DES40_1252 [Litorimonas taeanensis]